MPSDYHRPDEKEPGVEAGEALFAWPRQTGRLESVMAAIQERERRSGIRRSRWLWATGTGAAAALAGWLTVYPPVSHPAVRPEAPAHVARVMAPDRQVLPDGSLVELKDDSEVTLAYSAVERRIILVRGEAHFEVRKDPERVFVVDAGGVEFRAVGTAFAVQLGARRVEMIVTEGQVAVARGDARRGPEVTARPPLTIVNAGSQAEVHFDGPATVVPHVQPLVPQQLSERLAWRVPRLELNETPLAEVVAAFNRHGRVQLAIGDRSLDRVAISGILRADNASTLLRVLESNYGIRAEQGEGEVIVLRARRAD